MSFRRILCQLEVKYGKLLSLLFNVFICRSFIHRFERHPHPGSYQRKLSICPWRGINKIELLILRYDLALVTSLSSGWACTWLAALAKVSTANNLRRRGHNISNVYMICQNSGGVRQSSLSSLWDSDRHLESLHWRVWLGLVLSEGYRKWGSVLAWRAFHSVRTHSLEDCLVCYIVVYLEGKKLSIFRSISSSLANLISRVTLRLAKWATIKKEFSNY